MRKRLQRHGNSLALVIDRPVLQFLGWDSTTELELMPTAEGVLLKKQAAEPINLLDELLNEAGPMANLEDDSS